MEGIAGKEKGNFVRTLVILKQNSCPSHLSVIFRIYFLFAQSSRLIKLLSCNLFRDLSPVPLFKLSEA